MISGGKVDQIAERHGVRFIKHTDRIKGANQAKCRRTCQTILRKHGEKHLNSVLGLINSTKNRGNWSSYVVSSVSWLVLNRPDLVNHKDFLGAFDDVDLAKIQAAARRVNQKAPTVTMAILMSYELDILIGERAAA